jgi:hypothetical protein
MAGACLFVIVAETMRADSINNPEHRRKRAEEICLLADEISDENIKQTMLRLSKWDAAIIFLRDSWPTCGAAHTAHSQPSRRTPRLSIDMLSFIVMLGGVGIRDRDVGLVARFDYLTKRACFDDGREDFVLDSARMSTSDAMVQLGRVHLCRDEVGSA